MIHFFCTPVRWEEYCIHEYGDVPPVQRSGSLFIDFWHGYFRDPWYCGIIPRGFQPSSLLTHPLSTWIQQDRLSRCYADIYRTRLSGIPCGDLLAPCDHWSCYTWFQGLSHNTNFSIPCSPQGRPESLQWGEIPERFTHLWTNCEINFDTCCFLPYKWQQTGNTHPRRNWNSHLGDERNHISGGSLQEIWSQASKILLLEGSAPEQCTWNIWESRKEGGWGLHKGGEV